MRLAAISDIHGNIAALEAVLEDIERRDVSSVVNLGDCFSGPFDAPATAKRLMSLDLPTVRGNHDRQLFGRPKGEMGMWESWVIDDLSEDQLKWLKALPLNLTLGDIYLCHATPEQDDENWLHHRGPQDRLIARDLAGVESHLADVQSPVILCGHTHSPAVVRLPTGQIIVNPGSVGCPAYVDTRMEPNFIHQTGAPDARYAIVEHVSEGWTAELHSVPYDPTAMAALARSKGAETWAQAITTGWFV